MCGIWLKLRRRTALAGLVMSINNSTTGVKMRFVRVKKYPCRNGYMEVDLYHINDINAHKLPRAKREKISLPKQKNLNTENSRRAMRLVFNNNFKAGDYHITLTYGTDNLPANIKDARKYFTDFIKKLRKLYRRNGKELFYLYVIEEGAQNGRIHIHIIVNNAGISRDDIESLWSGGRANADRLQPDPDGSFNALANYLMKSAANAEKHARKWNCSRNLRRPVKSISDKAVSAKQLRSLTEAKRNDELQKAVEKLYSGYRLIKAFVSVNEVTGLPYAKLRLMKKRERNNI